MRRGVRIAWWLSAFVVVGAFLWAASLLADLREWSEAPDDASFLDTLAVTAIFAGPVLAFIWLCVFVAFVIRKGLRTFE